MQRGVNGLSSLSTRVPTTLSGRSRAPSSYSSPRSSRAAMVAAEIMPRSATTQTRPIAKRARRRSIPEAECIRVVQDNLSTHTRGSLYETFPAAEAHRILGRLEFHYTPKHASWLNMVEIEIGVLKGQCLDRRIDSREELEREIAAWERERNAAGARVNWMFTTEKARTKMGRAYPKPSAALDQPVNES